MVDCDDMDNDGDRLDDCHLYGVGLHESWP
jgi:hypothetical protein